MPKFVPLAAIALAAPLVLSGCVMGAPASPPATPVTAEPTAPEPEPSQPNGTLAFGQTYEYSDGVTLTVSAPEAYTPSASAAGATQAAQVLFTLTITNNGHKNLDPLPSTRVSSGGRESNPVFDFESSVNLNPPQTVVLPGQSVTWNEAWSVADPSQIVLETSPAFEYVRVIFTNS